MSQTDSELPICIECLEPTYRLGTYTGIIEPIFRKASGQDEHTDTFVIIKFETPDQCNYAREVTLS
jgi:hypothetical protein